MSPNQIPQLRCHRSWRGPVSSCANCGVRSAARDSARARHGMQEDDRTRSHVRCTPGSATSEDTQRHHGACAWSRHAHASWSLYHISCYTDPSSTSPTQRSQLGTREYCSPVFRSTGMHCMPYRHPMRLSTQFGGVNRTRQGGPAGATVCASVSAGLCHTISSMNRRRPIAMVHSPTVPPNNVAGQINLLCCRCAPNPCQAKSSCDTPCDRVPRPRTVHWSIHGTPVVHLPPGTYQPDNASSAHHGPRHLARSHCAQNGQHHKPCIS